MKCRGLTTYIYSSLKFNKFGRFISIITVNGESRSIIILPKNSFNEGWVGLAAKIESFIVKIFRHKKELQIGGMRLQKGRGVGRKGEVVCRGPFEPDFMSGKNDLLRRSLVGYFPDCDEIPTRNGVKRWVEQTCMDIHNIQVFDLNGIQFLFEFQSRRDAVNILFGKCLRQNHQLELDWWSLMYLKL